jgi:hypothetical protein
MKEINKFLIRMMIATINFHCDIFEVERKVLSAYKFSRKFFAPYKKWSW